MFQKSEARFPFRRGWAMKHFFFRHHQTKIFLKLEIADLWLDREWFHIYWPHQNLLYLGIKFSEKMCGSLKVIIQIRVRKTAGRRLLHSAELGEKREAIVWGYYYWVIYMYIHLQLVCNCHYIGQNREIENGSGEFQVYCLRRQGRSRILSRVWTMVINMDFQGKG